MQLFPNSRQRLFFVNPKKKVARFCLFWCRLRLTWPHVGTSKMLKHLKSDSNLCLPLLEITPVALFKWTCVLLTENDIDVHNCCYFSDFARTLQTRLINSKCQQIFLTENPNILIYLLIMKLYISPNVIIFSVTIQRKMLRWRSNSIASIFINE